MTTEEVRKKLITAIGYDMVPVSIPGHPKIRRTFRTAEDRDGIIDRLIAAGARFPEDDNDRARYSFSFDDLKNIDVPIQFGRKALQGNKTMFRDPDGFAEWLAALDNDLTEQMRALAAQTEYRELKR